MNILQIGANRGNDDLTDIIRPYKAKIAKLILVEPLSVHNKALIKCYSGYPFTIENIAISESATTNQLSFYYHVEDGPGYEVSSLNREHILKHTVFNPKLTEKGIREESVNCLTINQLCDKHSILNLDLLFIDAEGIDDKLIFNIDFKSLTIANIIYENLHIDSGKVAQYLESKGYHVHKKFGKNGWSTLATRNQNHSRLKVRKNVFQKWFSLLRILK
jgi:FkbM family methyltransferase